MRGAAAWKLANMWEGRRLLRGMSRRPSFAAPPFGFIQCDGRDRAVVSPPIPSFAGPSRTVRCAGCGRKIFAVEGDLCGGCRTERERQAVHTLKRFRRDMRKAERQWLGESRRWWRFW
jgi:hypothetical protein